MKVRFPGSLPAAASLTALLLTLPLAGCGVLDDLLSVENPAEVIASEIEAPENARLLVNSVIADFDCAFANYVVAGGLVGDELTWGDFNTLDYDRRTFTQQGGNYATSPCATGVGALGLGVYAPLSVARASADRIHTLLSGWNDAEVPDRGELLATTSAYGAYAVLLLGEAMCGAAIDAGSTMDRPALWTNSEARFTAAMNEAQAAGATAILVLARVGRARTRLNLGNAAGAVSDAEAVPAGFVHNATFAGVSWRSANQVYEWVNFQIRAAVEAPFWHLEFQGVPDPRVNLSYPAPGVYAHDGITPLVTQLKYPARNSPIPIARHAEAQLILAEVRGGQGAVGIINALHQAAGLPSFNSTDPVEIRDQVIEERRRELFLESHHLGDKIRLGLPFTPPAGAPYKQGGTYGTTTCFPFPDAEALNSPRTGG